MDAVAEAELARGPAPDVEAVGVGEVAGVPGGGGQRDQHGVARRYDGAADLHLFGREAERGGAHRPVVPEHLLDRAVDEAGIRTQGCELVGMGEEGEGPARDEVDRRLMAGDEQQEGHAEEFLGGERRRIGPPEAGGAACDRAAARHRDGPGRCGDERAQQVVTGVGPLVLDEGGEVARHAGDRRTGRLRRGGRDDLAGPGVEVAVVGRRHPEQLADDGQRQRQREGADEIGGARGDQRVEQAVQQPVGDLLDARAHRLDPACGELACDERPQPGVLGCVGLEHVEADGVPAVVRPGGGVADVVAQPGVGEGGAGLVAGDDQPCLAGSGDEDAVHRSFRAECGVDGVRVDDDVESGGRQVLKCRSGQGSSLPVVKRAVLPVSCSDRTTKRGLLPGRGTVSPWTPPSPSPPPGAETPAATATC